MATPKTLQKLINGTLAFVRGPFFLSVISVVLLLGLIPAQATLLRGYLQSGSSASELVQDDVESVVPKTEEDTTAFDNDVIIPKRLSSPEATQLHRAMIADNSFPPQFAGLWKCVTVVVDSAVSSVPVGQRVESAVNFVRTNDGRVVARWEQPGWTEAQANVVPVSDNEVSSERTNYYVTHGPNGGWAAHSRDRYLQIDANRIAASSAVEQFINGKYLGDYQTKSMLYRVSGDIALAKP